MGLRTNFTYTGRINSNLVFGAVSISEAKDCLVVKFVRQYSEDAHRFLGDLGYAPTLRAINSISGGWKMIAMDYSRYTELSKVTAEVTLDNITKLAIRQGVKEIIEKLHTKELVHGDIRQANILVDRNTLGSPEGVSLQLIDFDWAGPAGAVKYPMRLNTKTIRRPKNVAGGKLITKSDDLEMIDLLFEESPLGFCL
jgi:serine/threonine protein kinase